MAETAGKQPENAPASRAKSPSDSIWSARSRHQMGIFGAGAAFVLISSLLTRRSIYRRYTVTRPPFFHANMTPLLKINGGLEALDALGIATINVFSYSIMFGGGLFWVFNISTLSELKERIKMPLKLEEEVENVDPTMDDAVSNWPAAALLLKEEEKARASTTSQDEPIQSISTSHAQALKQSVLKEVEKMKQNRCREG